jgi:hypothetical protein
MDQMELEALLIRINAEQSECQILRFYKEKSHGCTPQVSIGQKSLRL